MLKHKTKELKSEVDILKTEINEIRKILNIIINKL